MEGCGEVPGREGDSLSPGCRSVAGASPGCTETVHHETSESHVRWPSRPPPLDAGQRCYRHRHRHRRAVTALSYSVLGKGRRKCFNLLRHSLLGFKASA